MRNWIGAITIALVGFLSANASAQEFLRGDINANGVVAPIEDALALIDYGFNGGAELACKESADANNNGSVNALSDSLYLLQWAFQGGSAPPAPGVEECGEDDVGALGCGSPPAECPAEEPELTEDDRVVLSIGSASIDSASIESVEFDVTIENDGPAIRGYQFGVCHDPAVVCVAEEGVQYMGVVDYEPFYLGIEITDGAWGVGAILDLVGGQNDIPEGDTVNVLRVAYSIMGEGSTELAFCNHPGEHGWPIRVFTADGPALPTVEDGSITVTAFDGSGECNATPTEIDPDSCVINGGEGEYTFDVGDGSGVEGGDVTIPVDLSVSGSCIIAWTFGICFEEEYLALDHTEPGAAADPVGTGFFSANSNADGNIAVGCILDFAGETVLEESDTTYEALLITYTIEGGFTETTISVCDSIMSNGTTTLAPGVIQKGNDVTTDASYDDGTVYFDSGLVSIIPTWNFERGDVDGNGAVFAIVDAMYLLGWAFNEGDAPPCMDAADIDDNGSVSGLVDALKLLRWGYLGGSEPAAPFETCDGDPTFDNNGCAASSPACK